MRTDGFMSLEGASWMDLRTACSSHCCWAVRFWGTRACTSGGLQQPAPGLFICKHHGAGHLRRAADGASTSRGERVPFVLSLGGGSWVVISGVISWVAIVITHIRGLSNPTYITSHEP